MVWTEMPQTPENLEIENKLDLKYFNNYLALNRYNSADSLQSPLSTCSSDLSTPDSAISPSSPIYGEPFDLHNMELSLGLDDIKTQDSSCGTRVNGNDNKVSISIYNKENNYNNSNNNMCKVTNNDNDTLNNDNDNYHFEAPCIIPSKETNYLNGEPAKNNKTKHSSIDTKNKVENLNLSSKLPDNESCANKDDGDTKPNSTFDHVTHDSRDKNIDVKSIDEFYLEEDPLNTFVNNGFGFECEENKMKYISLQRRALNENKKKETPPRRNHLPERPQTISAKNQNFIDYTEDLTTQNEGGGKVRTRKYFFDDFNYSSFSYADGTEESEEYNKSQIEGNERGADEKIISEGNYFKKSPFYPEKKNKLREETTFNNTSKQRNKKKSTNKNANCLSYKTKKNSDNKTYQENTPNEVKGLLTSCSILNGIWDDKKVPWNTKANKTDIKRNTEFQDIKYRTRRPSDGEDPLGPKFFAQVCNLWPDLIVRLALDINLETASPDNAPDPPDPPNESTSSGFPLWSSNSNFEHPNAVVANKCCSSEDNSCPQLPIETLVPNVCGGVRTPKRTLKDVSFDSNVIDGDAKKKHSSLDEESRKNKDKSVFESPKKKPTFEELGRSCLSPICGSPRPKAPCPIAEISEFECLEGEDYDEEMFISTIERGYEEEEEEEEEDIGVEGEDEEEDEDEELDEGEDNENYTETADGTNKSQNERMRRRLPEIPKNKKSFSSASILAFRTPTLAEEIQEAESGVGSRSSTPEGFSLLSSHSRPILVLKCHSYIRDDSSSPEADLRLHPQDIDSGHSTQHSPDGGKSLSPQAGREISPVSPCLGVPISQLELLDATHRGLYRFIPRHSDEVEIEIGDPIYVQKEADDLWCEGVNLRSGRQGIFPAAHVTDVDYSDFDPTVPKVKKERYLLNYLGSIETLCHKGNQVLCQAVRKIARDEGGPSSRPISCILEVSDQGIRMVDKSNSGHPSAGHDYFYHLKHVSFCGFHPKDPRYFGFITKHPAVQRFACHVFESIDSTRPVAEAVGRAFQRFYKKYIETAYPTEDIYIE